MNYLKLLIFSLLIFFLVSCALHPQPISDQARWQRVQHDMSVMYANQEPVCKPIDLYEAMARAVKYNLDTRLKLMDSILKLNELRLAGYDMLPQLAGDAGYAWRSNKNVIFSEDPETGQISNNSATSEDQTLRLMNLDATWNILDFGVSYFTAKQKADSYLIAEERQRRMMQNVVRDVRYAYWRAVSAQWLMREIMPLQAQAVNALQTMQQANHDKLRPPLYALEYEKRLLETLRDIDLLQRDAENAKFELAELMNIKPGTDFTVVEPNKLQDALPPGFSKNIIQLENEALVFRPELREEDYRTRMAQNEVRKARLSMLPGIEVTSGWNYNSNSFLLNNQWANYGLRTTWNLLNFFSGPQAIRTAQSDVKVADFRRMVLSVAIITQVDVAYLRYAQAHRELKVSQALNSVNRDIYEQMSKELEVQKSSPLDLIHARMEMILAQMRYNLSYADWQNAGGELLDSVGFDPIPLFAPAQSVGRQAELLRETYTQPGVMLIWNQVNFNNVENRDVNLSKMQVLPYPVNETSEPPLMMPSTETINLDAESSKSAVQLSPAAPIDVHNAAMSENKLTPPKRTLLGQSEKSEPSLPDKEINHKAIVAADISNPKVFTNKLTPPKQTLLGQSEKSEPSLSDKETNHKAIVAADISNPKVFTNKLTPPEQTKVTKNNNKEIVAFFSKAQQKTINVQPQENKIKVASNSLPIPSSSMNDIKIREKKKEYYLLPPDSSVITENN